MSSEKRSAFTSSPLFRTLFSVFTGLLVGAIVLLASGYSPAKAYRVIFDGIFSKPSYVSYTIIYATPLIMTGLSVAFAFKTGLFNIGAEGQFIMGALGAARRRLHQSASGDSRPCRRRSRNRPRRHGAGGYLKARFGVNEVIATIMLNWTALYLNNYIVTLPGIKRPAATATAFIPTPPG